MSLKQARFMPNPGKVIPVRFKAEDTVMLDRLAKELNTGQATIIRMAVKQLFDRTFPKK